MNPFFLSFIGIIAGLLSERAYIRMQGLGTTLLGASDAEHPRWAFGLAEAVAAANVEPSHVAQFVGASEADVKRWSAEEAPVPLQKQLPIACYLRRPLRSLLTDLPPEPREATGSGGTAGGATAGGDGAAAGGAATDGNMDTADVEAPNIAGRTEERAGADASRVGLVIGTISRESDPAAPSGTIIRQTPDAGTKLPKGSPVDVVVSTGPAAPEDGADVV